MHFEIAKHEVTNRDFADFVRAKQLDHPNSEQFSSPVYGGHPAVDVSWNEARDFADWVGGRLPTEAEWEMAATWDPDQMRKQGWPWGDEWNKDNLHSPIGKGTVPVTSLPESGSAHGVLHLVGNVSEWTSSADLPYPYDAGDGREDTTTITDRIVRGSAYSALPETAAPTNRSGFSPATRDPFIGFRVVWDK